MLVVRYQLIVIYLSVLKHFTWKKADPILEMPGPGEFCGYCFKDRTYEVDD